MTGLFRGVIFERMEMDEVYRQSLLFDFYGDLLTQRQRAVYEDAVFMDCSLSEVAAKYGISRQGVHDMLRRTKAALEKYEETLGLVDHFLNIKHRAEKILARTDDPEVKLLAEEILKEL